MGTDIINLPAVIPAKPADFADIAERIRGREQAIKDGFVAYIHNGSDLLAVKAKLDHGQFELWCEAEFGSLSGWSKRAIERSMSAAVHFGDKIEALARYSVPKTVVYAVSARTVPEPARQSLIAKIVAGESVRLTDIQAVAKSTKLESALTPEGKAADEKKRKAREARVAKRQRDDADARAAREAEREQAADTLSRMIVSRMGDDAERCCELMGKAYGFQVLAKVRSAREAEQEQAEGMVVRVIVARIGIEAERVCEATGKAYYGDVAKKVRAALAPPPPPVPMELELPQPMSEDVSSVVMDDRAMRKAEFFAMKQNKNRRHVAR